MPLARGIDFHRVDFALLEGVEGILLILEETKLEESEIVDALGRGVLPAPVVATLLQKQLLPLLEALDAILP